MEDLEGINKLLEYLSLSTVTLNVDQEIAYWVMLRECKSSREIKDDILEDQIDNMLDEDVEKRVTNAELAKYLKCSSDKVSKARSIMLNNLEEWKCICDRDKGIDTVYKEIHRKQSSFAIKLTLSSEYIEVVMKHRKEINVVVKQFLDKCMLDENRSVA